MGALPPDLNAVLVHRGVGRAGQAAVGARVHAVTGEDVECQGRAHMVLVQKAVVQQHLHAGDALLVALEDQKDRARQALLPLLEQPGRPQEHGGMDVVAAGVHPAVGGGEALPALLQQRQGVHVGPEEEGVFPLLPAYAGDNATVLHDLVRDRKLL